MTDGSGDATFNVTLNISVPFGQTITATATDPNGNTSALATPVTVTNPFVVTTTTDNGDNTNPTIGSLRQVINSINAATAGTNTITFDISGSGGPYIIQLMNGTPLPMITRPVLIDGTSEPGYVSTPLIELDANGASAGLTLGPGSDDSTIQGLSIIGAAGPGILIDSGSDQVIKDELGVTPTGTNGANQVGVLVDNVSQVTIGGTAANANTIGFNTMAGVSISGTAALKNVVAANFIGTDSSGDNLTNNVGVAIDGGASNNTIGGTVNGAGNTIDFGSGNGVDVDSGTGNSIRENRIYGTSKNTGIVLSDSANNSQPAPSELAYTSVPTLTTIDYTVNGTKGETYAIDFFASNGLGGPASVYLGSTTVTLTGSSQSVTATFNLPSPLLSTQTVTATATDPNGNTSAFPLTAAGFTDPFQVDTGTDGVVGSLRQAILDSNADPGTPITFTLPSPYQINLTVSLPLITKPVNIEGTSLSGYVMGTTMVQLIGNTNNVGGDGLTLGTGSQGSTISGLAIGGFLSGAGIRVETNNNQILGDYLGVLPGATPPSTPNELGIYVSGSNNTIGGTTPGTANTVADNDGSGVTVDTGTGDLISGNAIYNNSQGIVLQNGGNQMLGFNGAASPPAPTLTVASTSGTQIAIQGSLQGYAANTVITIEFFAGATGDQTTVPDQANVYLGYTTVTTNATGATQFSVTSLLADVPMDSAVTATASVPDLGTSPLATNIEAASPLEVTTTDDNGSNTNPTVGSLRAAILAANKATMIPTIQFDLPITDPGYNLATRTWTFTLDPTPLPAITSPVVIDGTTQFGYYNQAANNTADPPPVILIDAGGAVGNGLTLASGSDGSTITGLAIFGFNSGTGQAGAGIDVLSNKNLIAADWLGYDPAAGSVTRPSNAVGLAIEGGSNNTIGLGAVLSIAPPAGSTLSAITVSGSNLISGNTGDGIQITSPVVGIAATGNLIQDSFLGTDAAGDSTSSSFANGGYGIEIDNALNNTVGGTTSDTRVLVSGNALGGILISGDPPIGDPPQFTASANMVQNTYIGTNLAGSLALANAGDGVVIDGSTANTIGGTVAATVALVDLISGNAGVGVMIEDGASDNVVENSYIGSDIVGENAVRNRSAGVEILNSSNNTIGADGFENLISGNSVTGQSIPGVLISGSNSQDNAVIDSLIGLGLTGSQSLPNSGDGIDIIDAVGTMVGFTGSLQNPTPGGNTISGNLGNGASISGSASGTVLLYNKIGTDGTGTLVNNGLANQGYGVLVDTTNSSIGATIAGTTIGGTIMVPSSGGIVQGSFNEISGNAQGGIHLEGLGSNVVAGNLIGTDITGIVALGNSGEGVWIDDTSSNTIGGTATGAGNLISANSGAGVLISGTGATANVVPGNIIGTDVGGKLARGNTMGGVVIADASNNTIGGTAAGASNLISANLEAGVSIGSGASANAVLANQIGTDTSGSAALGNAMGGIVIADATDNTIGAVGRGQPDFGQLRGGRIDRVRGQCHLGRRQYDRHGYRRHAGARESR